MNTPKKILFIIPPYLLNAETHKKTKSRSFKSFPYGILSIASYLNLKCKNRVKIKIIDCNNEKSGSFEAVIKETFFEFKPDIVGISIMFDNSYKHIKKISSLVKKDHPNTIIILGGAATTPSYLSMIEQQNNIDGICFGEGEEPLLRLVNSDDMRHFLDNDPSWITRKSIKDGQAPDKSTLENLDDAINIDYSLIDISEYSTMKESFSPFAGFIENPKQFFIVTSRGCPFKCSFCMHSSDNDKRIRFASVDKIIEHVEFLVKNYKMNILTFYDDQILFNKKRAKQLFRELAKFKLRIECPNGLSVAYIDEEMAELMKNAGMDTVCLAIESGSPHVLYDIIHKPLRLEQVKPVVGYFRKLGFWIHGYFVSGMPGETDVHRKETLDFIKDVGLDWAGFSLAAPSIGSELYNICIEKGYIKKLNIGELDVNKYIINTPEYTAEEIIEKTYLMNLDINFVNNFRMRHKDYETAAKSFVDVINRYPDHAFAHYFLAKALNFMGEAQKAKQSIYNLNNTLKQHTYWEKYFKHFKIDLANANEVFHSKTYP